MMTRLEIVEEYGVKAKGKSEFIKYLEGDRLTPRQTILAKCYECTNFYADGRMDCKISDCPSYPYMPYREGGVKPTKKVSEEQKEKARQRMTEKWSSVKQ